MNISRHDYASPHKGLLIDANLLTVLIVGALGRGEIERFKCTRHFSDEDASAVDRLTQQFGWVSTTPHVITEVSNLLDWLDQSKRATALSYLAEFARSSRELGFPSAEIVDTPVYLALGITDAALCMAAAQDPLVVLTVDLPLYQYATGLRVDVINFNHIRQEWLFD